MHALLETYLAVEEDASIVDVIRTNVAVLSAVIDEITMEDDDRDDEPDAAVRRLIGEDPRRYTETYFLERVHREPRQVLNSPT